MMFQPIGDYAMDVNWMHIRFELNLAKAEEHTAAMKDQLRAMYESTKQDHKRFPAIPALIDSTRDTLMRHHETYRGTLAVIPTPVDHHRVKRQLALIGGIVGTIFGAMNQIEIIKINEHIKQGDQERKLLVDITKINSASIDKLEKTVDQVLLQLKELALYDVPLIEVHLAHNLRSLIDEYERIEKLIQGVHQHRLPLGIIHQDIMEDLLDHIQVTAKHLGLTPSATEVSHLYQMDLSYLSEGPGKITLILHVPLFHDEVMLKLYKFVSTPILFNATMGHTVMPRAPNEDYIAFNNENLFKVLKESELALCRKLGNTYLCSGRTAAMTQMDRTCLGSLITHNFVGIEKHCEFETEVTREQVFEISSNRWLIHSEQEYRTQLQCETGISPVRIHQRTEVSIPSGCKLALQDYILYAEQEEYMDIDPHLVDLDFKELPVFKRDLALLDEAIGLLRNDSINRFKAGELLATVEKMVQTTLDYDPIDWAVPTLLCLLFAAIAFCIYYFRLCPRFCPCGKHRKRSCGERRNFNTETEPEFDMGRRDPIIKTPCHEDCGEPENNCCMHTKPTVHVKQSFPPC